MASPHNPLDAPLQTSLHRIVLWAVFFMSIFGIVAVVGLVWWQWVVLLLVVVGLIWSMQSVPSVRHLVQLPTHQGDDGRWQLLVATHRGEQLWQGRLTAANDFGLGVQLSFEIDEPMPQIFGVVVFFDQLDDDDKRKLKVAVRFF